MLKNTTNLERINIIICGASGSGKTKVKDMLLNDFPCSLYSPVTITTMEKRSGYHYASDYLFNTMSNLGMLTFETSNSGIPKFALEILPELNPIYILDTYMALPLDQHKDYLVIYITSPNKALFSEEVRFNHHYSIEEYNSIKSLIISSI